MENWDTGSPSAEAAIKEHRTRGHPHEGKGENPRKLVKLEPDDYHCDQVGVATVQQAPSHSDPNTIHISDVQIDATTEAFATVEMPAEIGPCQCGTLKCKVDTGAGGNVMPLQTFAKLFPRHINADGSPRGPEAIHNMPDSLQQIQNKPVWNTGYCNRLGSQRKKCYKTIYGHDGT